MSDVAKRNSGRVATPKQTGSPLPGEVMETAMKAVGGRVRLTNTLNTTFEGTLYTVDPTLRLIALNTRSPPPNPSTNPASVPGDYHIIPIASIRDFHVLSLGEKDYLSQTAPTKIDTRLLQNRLEKRVEQLREEKQHKGQGVSEDAQRLYDRLRQVNIPVRWHAGRDGPQMIVHDAVMVSAPFEPANCVAPADKQAVLQLVKRVIEGERKKLGLSAASGGVRKGG
ncbi:hypothetical protein CBER1_06586 [Cercospora berteroae]|uniref:AD domain-containing protein n=1 Tax=Cercospora berteroae TaxID=357750 RepID=A0A2S6BUJ5_9PEZI|nr:hypothetical protein CBER1_06586 [Cercospora berteroae]